MRGTNILSYTELVIFQYTILKLDLIAFVTAKLTGFIYALISLEYKLWKHN